MEAKTFAEFDDALTAPLHGFQGKNEYYDRCSSSSSLRDIRRPTLIINSLDDPFMTPAAVPDLGQLSETVQLELANRADTWVSLKAACHGNPVTTCPVE